MKQDKLDRNIGRYYRDQKLDDATLERLTRMIREGEKDHATLAPSLSRLMMAAAAVLVAVATGALLLLTQTSPSSDQVALEISQQAALGHNQKLDIEFEADDYQELRTSMTRLGFEPVGPVRFNGMNMKVLGARYGSIHGQPAVQISLLDPDGEICTLYQLRPVGELAELNAESRQIDGLIVDMWQEKGLLMVLARPAA